MALHIKAVFSGQNARHPIRNTSCPNLGSKPKKGCSLQNPKLKLMLKWVLNNPFTWPGLTVSHHEVPLTALIRIRE